MAYSLSGKLNFQSARVAALIALWIAAVSAGFGAMVIYAHTPGGIDPPPSADVAGIAVSPTGFTLVLVVHPECSCTRATLAQLEELLNSEPTIREMCVVLARPAGRFQDWGTSGMGQAIGRLPRVHIRDDEGCGIAGVLGVSTSGSVVLYDSAGSPRFWGGVTPSRSHVGPADGIDAIRSVVRGREQFGRQTPVFGCPLKGAAPAAHACPLCDGAGK